MIKNEPDQYGVKEDVMNVAVGQGIDRKKLLIGGEWLDAASGETFAVRNPATEEVIAECAAGDAADVDKAVAAARRAFVGPWRGMLPAERARLMWRIAEAIEAHTEELATLESRDNGKPVAYARMVDVPWSAEIFRYMAGWATKLEGNTIPVSAFNLAPPGTQFHAYTVREPVGVVGQIIPWNFPLLMAAWKIAPALATGCTVVLKPAEETPLTALRLGQIMLEAGLPEGVVNVVTGFGETAGAAIAAHPDIDKVAFTGSTEVGRLIAKAATGNLKKVTLELGGKSPNIIFDDADLSQAIPGAANAIFFNSGQVCAAGSRLYVQRRVFDEVVGGLGEAAKSIVVGNGADPATQMGPLVSGQQLSRVTDLVNSGLQQGARAVTGGGRTGDVGYFFQPTLFADVRPDMRVCREEIFGPVVVAAPFDDPSEVPPIANNSIYGLAAGVWTRDVAKAHRMAAAINAGTVWVNCYSVMDPALPFGGYKQSGWGREMGHAVLENYTESKTVVVQI